MRGATNTDFINKKKRIRFQSTRPMRGATSRATGGEKNSYISIHAPHAGRDNGDEDHQILMKIFQSTRPMRGATKRIPPM